MHKKVQCTCKDVELPIAFFKSLSFFSPLLVWRQYRYQQWPFSHHRRIIHVQNLSKLTGKQMDKVRRIVHLKLRPFHFQIKTYYLSDANYPTDNPSQTDNLSLVWVRLIGVVPLNLFLKVLLWEIAWIGLALGFDHFHVCGYTAINCPRRKKTVRGKRRCKHWRLT